MLQIFPGRTTAALSTSATQYVCPISGLAALTTTEALARALTGGGTFKNFRVKLTAAPGSGKSRTFNVLKDGVATGITVTISDLATTGTDLVHTSVFGDRTSTISLQSTVSNTPAAATAEWSLEWEGTTAGESFYAVPFLDNSLGSTTRYYGIIGGNQSSTEALTSTLIGAPGTITGYAVVLTVAPGTNPRARNFCLMKNGVAQDGTGGTVDTTSTIITTGTTASPTFSLPVAEGDRISLRHTVTNTPAAASAIFYLGFTPTTDGDMMLCVTEGGSLNNAASVYNALAPRTADLAWDATEGNRQIPTWLSAAAVSAKKIVVRLDGAPGATSRAYALSLRQNGSSVLTATVTDPATTQTATGTVALAANDLLAIQSTPSGTPSTRAAKVSVVINTAAASVTGTLASTLGALTASGTGKVQVKGTASATLGALTSTAAGKVQVKGTTAATLGALTSSATGTVRVSGQASVTLGALTAAGAGVVPVKGSLAATLGALSATGTGAVRVTGQTTATLGAVTCVATGAVLARGAAAVTLGALTATATGAALVVGQASITLGPLTLSAAGAVAVHGALATTLGPLTLTGTGVGGDTATGELAATLGPLTVAGVGRVQVRAAAAIALGALTASATGAVQVKGTAAITLGVLSVAASGRVLVRGVLAVTLGALTATASGTIVRPDDDYVADHTFTVPERLVRFVVPPRGARRFTVPGKPRRFIATARR